MNYFKNYSKLIRNAQCRENPSVYCEKHHIFPVSIFGKNNSIVVLTAKEHYIAHLLLYKICLKRYGLDHRYTIKMARAWWNMTLCGKLHKRHTARSFTLAREAMAESFKGDKNPSKKPGIGAKISKAKLNISRPDLKNKSYFGAGPEAIKKGIEKMRQKKIGLKISYPKNRKSPPCSSEKAEKIRQSRLETKEKFISMSETEFKNWLNRQSLYCSDGKRKNSNVTRVLMWRNIPIDKYYNK